jgi:DNA invertase Pin-like site-specific DNA recombinase
MGRFLLTQMASVAELEAGLVSERTKAFSGRCQSTWGQAW